MSVNKVMLVGNIGQDPETRYTEGGMAVGKFSLATSRKRGGEESTQWHRIKVFGKTAEFCDRYLTKGRTVCVIGRIEYGDYTPDDGIKRYTVEIIADEVQAVGARADGGGGQQHDSYGQGGASGYQRDSGPPQRKPEPAPYNPGDYDPKGGDDDIPF